MYLSLHHGTLRRLVSRLLRLLVLPHLTMARRSRAETGVTLPSWETTSHHITDERRPLPMAKTTTDTRPLHEIRKDGKCCMSWRDPNCGYSRETLRSMKEAGYRHYVDGKLQR